MLKYEMKEKLNNIESTNNFDADIQEIIKKMDIRRGRTKDLSEENIREKIMSDNPNKIGEYWEFQQECELTKGNITPNLALEMADIIYYTSQKNCPDDLKSLANKFEKMIGISHKLAQEFCIIKYSCRLEQPIDSKEHKVKERQKMTDFLNNRKIRFLP